MKRLNDNQEQRAQRVACTHLVRGCERAVSDLSLAAGETGEHAAIGERANAILGEVLFSWRETSEALRPADPPESVPPVAPKLDGWTSDELFAVVVERQADNAPALVHMQGTLLRARLAAHDAAASRAAQPD